jgi:staphylococcal nuclease domain-containing protein 1
VAFANIRPLDPRFRSLPGQAHDARLRCVSVSRHYDYIFD